MVVIVCFFNFLTRDGGMLLAFNHASKTTGSNRICLQPSVHKLIQSQAGIYFLDYPICLQSHIIQPYAHLVIMPEEGIVGHCFPPWCLLQTLTTSNSVPTHIPIYRLHTRTSSTPWLVTFLLLYATGHTQLPVTLPASQVTSLSPGVHSQRCFADLHKQRRLVPASLSVHNTVDKERKVTCGLLCDLSYA